MVYTCRYKSPLGEILLAANEIGLTGLWFEGELCRQSARGTQVSGNAGSFRNETLAGYLFYW